MSVRTWIRASVAGYTENLATKKVDHLAVEEPLEIRIGNHPLYVTMRTPGQERELAAGFLFTEGILGGPNDINSIHGPDRSNPNRVSIKLRRGVQWDRKRLERYFPSTSSCGICGKTALEAIQMNSTPLESGPQFPLSLFYSLSQKLREEQETFEETGGLHAAAVFDKVGSLIFLSEDVGRHNAVDKVLGRALLERKVPLGDHVLMVSGRTSFEILQKALAARIPVVAGVSAPSSLAVALARRFRVTLIGFLRGQSCNIYAGEDRIVNNL